MDRRPRVLPVRDGQRGPHRPQPAAAQRPRARRDPEREELLGRVGRRRRLHGQDGRHPGLRGRRLGAAQGLRVLGDAHGHPPRRSQGLQARRHAVPRPLRCGPHEERRQRQRPRVEVPHARRRRRDRAAGQVPTRPPRHHGPLQVLPQHRPGPVSGRRVLGPRPPRRYGLARHWAAVQGVARLAGAASRLRRALPAVPQVLRRTPRSTSGPRLRLRPVGRARPGPYLSWHPLLDVRRRPDTLRRHARAVRRGHGDRRVRILLAGPALQPRQAGRAVKAPALPRPDHRHRRRHGLDRRRPPPRPAAVRAAPPRQRLLRHQGPRNPHRQARLRRQRRPRRTGLPAPAPALLECGCVLIIFGRSHRLRRSPRRRVVGASALQHHPR